MGLFGSNKDDTRAKIEELKAKMQGAPQQQQAWQGQPQQAPEGWQPPRQQEQQAPAQQAPVEQPPQKQPVKVETSPSTTHSHSQKGILLDLGDGMSLNLPIREKMDLSEFLQIADRVRELKRIDHR